MGKDKIKKEHVMDIHKIESELIDIRIDNCKKHLFYLLIGAIFCFSASLCLGYFAFSMKLVPLGVFLGTGISCAVWYICCYLTCYEEHKYLLKYKIIHNANHVLPQGFFDDK